MIRFEHRYITLKKSKTRNGKALYCCKYCQHITPCNVKGYCDEGWTVSGYTVFDGSQKQLSTFELEEDIRTS